MTIYICNAFSLSMLDRAQQQRDPRARYGARYPRPITIEEARRLLQPYERADGRTVAPDVTSAVGHADTAVIFSGLLGYKVASNRISVRLRPDDVALIGQYIGPRLPEGATALPDGAAIEWWLV